MITKTKSYTTSDKRAFSTVEEAKQHELKLRLMPDNTAPDSAIGEEVHIIVEKMVKDPATFIAILKASEPKKRAPKKPKAKASPAQAKAA